MSSDHDRQTIDQFGPSAQNYVSSATHATGADLDVLRAAVLAGKPEKALDLGCGGGHVAYALASGAQKIFAVDLSAQMLAAVAAQARQRGLKNLETIEASAENLPFADENFDFLASRYSAHHWRDLGAGLAESRRVLKRGAPAFFIDIVAPERAALDSFLQSIEVLRDISHARDYTVTEWRRGLVQAGFAIERESRWRLPIGFAEWTARLATPAALAAAILQLQAKASRDIVEHFAFEPDGSFALDAALFQVYAT